MVSAWTVVFAALAIGVLFYLWRRNVRSLEEFTTAVKGDWEKYSPKRKQVDQVVRQPPVVVIEQPATGSAQGSAGLYARRAPHPHGGRRY